MSRLVLSSSKIGVLDRLGPGLDLADRLACSLCCQQYRLSSRGSSARNLPPARKKAAGEVVFALAIGRLQGRPEDVMPRQVVEGFLESERPTCDSGVFAKNGILVVLCLAGLLGRMI